MARPEVLDQLNDRHLRSLTVVRALSLRQIELAWRAVDPERLDLTSPTFVSQAIRSVEGGHALAARSAAEYYSNFRAAGGTPGPAPDVVPAELDVDQVRTSMVVTGPVRVKQSTAARVPFEVSMRNALAQVAAAAGRFVFAGSVDTIRNAVGRDDEAIGWTRVASSKACAFCIVLCSQGAVYKSRDSGGFDAHDGCGCRVEPAFPWSDEPDIVARARDAWYASQSPEWRKEYREDVARKTAKATSSKQRDSQLINGSFRQYLARNPI